MEETITFWLDNKICSGFKIAAVETQTLVLYRDKYYIVVAGAAKMNGVRPLHYSKTSLPTLWKKAIKGIMPPVIAAVTETCEDEHLPVTTSKKRERAAMPKSTISPSGFPEDQPETAKPELTVTKKSAATRSSNEVKPMRQIQTVVAATCPYCSHKQELPFEKGKNGKPFFTVCMRCNTEFGVRFVPVTVFQAQVAAFK